MDTARECYYALRELVARYPGGASSEAAAAALRKLCRVAALVVDDAACAAAIGQVQACGEELFSGCSGGNWVRRRLLRALEDYQARLSVLEASRGPRNATAVASR